MADQPFTIMAKGCCEYERGKVASVRVQMYPATVTVVQPSINALTGFPFAPQAEKRHETERHKCHDSQDCSHKTRASSHT